MLVHIKQKPITMEMIQAIELVSEIWSCSKYKTSDIQQDDIKSSIKDANHLLTLKRENRYSFDIDSIDDGKDEITIIYNRVTITLFKDSIREESIRNSLTDELILDEFSEEDRGLLVKQIIEMNTW